MKLQNGDQLYYQTKLTSENIWKFPIRFLIQAVRRKSITVGKKDYSFEHMGVYVDGYSYESLKKAHWDSSKKGTIKTPINFRLSVNSGDTKVMILRLKNPLSSDESERLKKDYQLHLNRKYSITEAVISWFENWLPEKLRKKWFKEPTTDEFFCSKYVNMGFYNIMRLKTLPRLFTPNESFIHWLPKCKVIKYDME
jgi:hypothetical protein